MGLSPYPNITEIEITIAGVKKLLLGLDPSKSPGPDKIPGKLLKVMVSEIAPCLSLVLAACLHRGSYLYSATRLETSFGNSTI